MPGIIRRLTGTLAGHLRHGRFGRWLLDDFPTRVHNAGGSRQIATRRVSVMLRSFRVDAAEPAMTLRHYDGGDFLDVGAHHGGYCFLLAEHAKPGSVFVAFEPAPVCFPFLSHNLATFGDLYPHVRFVPVPLPVGNGGECEFTYPMGQDYHPRVVSRTQGAAPSSSPGVTATARAVSVDETVAFLGVKPSFIKVDVEGAEVFVVEGMRSTLERLQPTIMLEFHPGFQPSPDCPARIHAVFAQAGYRMLEEVDSHVARQQIWKPDRR